MPTLTLYRRSGAKAAGRYVQGTVKSSGSTTTSFVVDALKTLGTATDQYDDWWVYLPAASATDKVRIVSSYTAASGLVNIDRDLSGASVADSKVVELHGVLTPFCDDLTIYSWTDAVNDALKRLWLPVEFTITPTANAIRHTLASTTWITSENQVLDVGWLTTGETRAGSDPYKNRGIWGEVERDGGTLYLNTSPRTFSTSETIYVRAAKRAYDHCKPTAGAFGDQAGLALETDEAVPQTEAIMWGACVAAARNLRNELNDAAADHISAHQAEWARMWTKERRIYHGKLPQGHFKPRRSFWLNPGFT